MFRAFAPTPHAEVEHHRPMRPPVLPQISQMVAAIPIVHLYPHPRFIPLPAPSPSPLPTAFPALGHPQEILRRLATQLPPPFVADPRGSRAATAAHALLGRAGDHPLDPRQFRRQRLAARMLANPFLRWSPRHRLACTLRLHFGGAHSPFQLP